jgi:hypothetical protein
VGGLPTRFEDQTRLPMGVSVNSTSYSAKLLQARRGSGHPAVHDEARVLVPIQVSALMQRRCRPRCGPAARQYTEGQGCQPQHRIAACQCTECQPQYSTRVDPSMGLLPVSITECQPQYSTRVNLSMGLLCVSILIVTLSTALAAPQYVPAACQ